jgi:hypothetical protein
MCLIGWGWTIWGSSVLKQNCRQVTACDYQQHPIPQSAFYVKLFLYDTHCNTRKTLEDPSDHHQSPGRTANRQRGSQDPQLLPGNPGKGLISKYVVSAEVQH